MNTPRQYDLVLGGKDAIQTSLFQQQPHAFAAVLGFVPSIYQRDIFEWVQYGEGACVVSAVPGSGKTKTLISAERDYISKKNSVKFLSFNKHIAEELKKKVSKRARVSTIHSLGLSGIKAIYKGDCKLNQNKYKDILVDLLTEKKITLTKGQLKDIKALIVACQLTLIEPTPEKLKQIAIRYSILHLEGFYYDLAADIIKIVLERGLRVPEYTFNDMVWLPNKHEVEFKTFDFLCVDECQDLNPAQLGIVLRSFTENSKALFVGDEHQSIFGFAFAATNAIQQIIQKTNAIIKPLSICYRCPISHIELANKVYPVIEPKANAIKGIVAYISVLELLNIVKVNDYVICRTYYPLFKLYYRIIGKGIPVKIKKKGTLEFLLQVLMAIRGIASDDDISYAALKTKVNYWLTIKRNEYAETAKHTKDMLPYYELQDRAQCILEIYLNSDCNLRQIEDVLTQMCTPTTEAVILSPIHGAKGLETETVFFLEPKLVPHPKATTEEQKIQERNLKFVALSRSTYALYFVE